jgi:hypothetical protein
VMGEMGAESSDWYPCPELVDRLETARPEELLPLWSALLYAREGRRRPRDASAAGLLIGLVGTGLRFMLATAGTGSVSKADIPCLRGPDLGGELWRPKMGDSPSVPSSGSVTSATEWRLVLLVRRPRARFDE